MWYDAPADVSFDWFFKSRTPEELRRRGATLLLCIMKDMKDDEDKKPAKGGKKRVLDDLKSTHSRDTTPSAAGEKKSKLSDLALMS